MSYAQASSGQYWKLAEPTGHETRRSETKQPTTGSALDATWKGADKAIDATKDAADKTKEIAGKTADKTREIVGEVAQKSQQVASATGETVTDAWITTKVKAKFADEKLLEGSDIHVDTNDRVITLAGTVPSREARERAVSIASGTEGVTLVVNHLVVKSSADPPWRPCCAPQANQLSKTHASRPPPSMEVLD